MDEETPGDAPPRPCPVRADGVDGRWEGRLMIKDVVNGVTKATTDAEVDERVGALVCGQFEAYDRTDALSDRETVASVLAAVGENGVGTDLDAAPREAARAIADRDRDADESEFRRLVGAAVRERLGDPPTLDSDAAYDPGTDGRGEGPTVRDLQFDLVGIRTSVTRALDGREEAAGRSR